jgi:NAD(P)-dependent dehydrogenase (short-subunit alcohol dehydrogenase family)
MSVSGEQRAVLVTGAGGGIGAAVVRRFLADGWHVVLTDLSGSSLQDVSASLRSDHTVVTGDVRSVQDCHGIVETAARAVGRLDAVVNAAGVWTEGASEEVSEDEWDRVIDVNLKGTFFVTGAAIPHLRETKGCVINLSSDAGIHGIVGAAVYCASKGGVTLLTKALALELARDGVRVNAVCPGDVATPMLSFQATAFGAGDEAGYYQRLLDAYPQKENARFIEPEEVAELIWFLAQPLATPMTGACVSIDFGLTAGI